jgi:hypothetical protein
MTGTWRSAIVVNFLAVRQSAARLAVVCAAQILSFLPSSQTGEVLPPPIISRTPVYQGKP